MNMNIIVATHKKVEIPETNYHKLIQVGSEGKEDLGYIKDNSGDHISNKNPNYCELTALYWAWKNFEECDYLGLTHYRRFFISPKIKYNLKFLFKIFLNNLRFSIHKKPYSTHSAVAFNKEAFSKELLKTEKQIEKDIKKYDVILPRRAHFSINIKSQYCYNHVKEDINILEEVVTELYPEYKKSFRDVMRSNNVCLYNMFIANKEFYENYCKWLFDILFEVEKRVKVSQYPYQQRVFGFMSERLLNIYIKHNNLKTKFYDVAYLD